MTASAKRPASGRGWREVEPWRPLQDAHLVVDGTVYRRGRLLAISSLEQLELPDGSGETGPQWHLSVSRFGSRRPNAKELARTLSAFDLADAEEDNHHPGRARHFFLPVDPARRRDCECKETEETIVEPDGYRWTNPRPGADDACRGCEWELRMGGEPCPLHGVEPTP